MASFRWVLQLHKDVPRAARFYSEGLDLTINVCTPRWAELQSGALKLALMQSNNCDNTAQNKGYSSMISFTVTDINSTVTKLMMLGAELDGSIKYEIHGKNGRVKERMAMVKPLKNLISHVIFDLDDTLLKTDGIVTEVLKVYLTKYGKEWNSRGLQRERVVGKTPLEAAASLVDHYELQCSTQDLLSEITPMLSCQWYNIKALPGAYRLIKHLISCGVPIALASNSPRSDVESKISYHKGWKDSFSVIIGGDEVKTTKPSPEIFLEAAKRMNADPSSCLVVEDSIPGIIAGKAAGMKVLAVPSLRKQAELFCSADEVINSLLDFSPGRWGLPPFSDWIEKTLPTEPWFVGGPVIKGFGRGSKLLGIPTANLPLDKFSGVISEMPSGVYFGWAGLSNRGIYKMVMSVGWNPYFDNTEKTMEPWLLHEFEEDFYGEELRLAVIGYIRPEANFPSLESLVARIREDGRIAEKALDLPLYAAYREEPYLKNAFEQ